MDRRIRPSAMTISRCSRTPQQTRLRVRFYFCKVIEDHLLRFFELLATVYVVTNNRTEYWLAAVKPLQKTVVSYSIFIVNCLVACVERVGKRIGGDNRVCSR